MPATLGNPCTVLVTSTEPVSPLSMSVAVGAIDGYPGNLRTWGDTESVTVAFVAADFVPSTDTFCVLEATVASQDVVPMAQEETTNVADAVAWAPPLRLTVWPVNTWVVEVPAASVSVTDAVIVPPER